MEVNIIAVRSMFNRYRWDFFEKNKDKFFERRNHAMRNRFYINDDCTLFFNITEDKQFLILIHYKDKKYKYTVDYKDDINNMDIECAKLIRQERELLDGYVEGLINCLNCDADAKMCAKICKKVQPNNC